MKTILPENIKLIQDAEKFLTDLHNNGESYHPEDNAEDCLENITEDEAKHLNRLMNEIYLLPGNEHYQNMVFDPCQFILELDPDYINEENFHYQFGKKLMSATTQIEINEVCAKFKSIAAKLNIQ